jgi:acetyl esterase/lipase
MITGSNRVGLSNILDWAQELGIVIASIEYRLAPAHPHPAPVDDCYAGLLWVASHGVDIGIDPSRLMIAGVSAGGGLCAAVALMARDLGDPPLIGQMLMCPMLDDRNDTLSAKQMEGLGVWDRSMNQVGWSALLGEAAGGPGVSPYASPAREEDLSHLPPTFIDVSSTETFRDEAITYASRIWACGGDAELHVWPGGFHGFDVLMPSAQLSRDAHMARSRWLSRQFRRAG